jgi:hypothetical protein
MRSVIHASDAIDNKTHEFGESLEPRIAAVFITDDGYLEPMILTRSQVVVAMQRADREPGEAQEIMARHARRRRADMTMVVASIAFSGLAGFAAGAWGL